MKRAIISGATGAIGIALTNLLIENGVETLILCRKDSRRKNTIPEHPLVRIKDCSLSDLSDVRNDTGKTYDLFFHFAWDGTVGDARNDYYLQNRNVRYSLDAVAAAARFGCKTFVGAGSQAEYGRVEGLLTPDTPTNPETGYGIAKLCAGQMTREYSHRIGLRHIWVRILSVYGPHDGENSMITSTIRKLKNGQTAEFTKGEQLWDYLYSGDAAKALYLVGENGTDGKVYVLGSGNAKPLSEYIGTIRDLVDPHAKISLGAIPYADRQVMHLCADITELTKDVGWHPETDFAKGISETLKYI